VKRLAVSLSVALAVLALQGCHQSPPQTIVRSAGPSLPDDTVLNGPAAAASAPAPSVAAAPQAEVPDTSAMGAQPAPPASVAPAPADAGTPAGTAAPTEMMRAIPSTPAASASHDQVSVRDTGNAQGAQLLAQHALQLPVAGVQPTSLSDGFAQGRGKRKHEAIDILAPAGTPVVAADDGRIAKLFTSKPGGLTIYQFDPQQQLAYYYAHLQGYAAGVKEGMAVHRGELIGYVGSTGNADPGTPHLHFAVFRLGTPPKWWQGEAVNPYPALTRAQPTMQVAQR